jgi:type II secretory pathway pseudopilin PulG
MRGQRAAAFRASLAVGAAVLLAVALVLLQPQLQGAGRQIGLAEEFTSQSNAAHSAIRQRLSGGQKRKGNKRKPQDAEVLPLEREAQSAETIAAEMEASLVGEIDLLQPSDKPCSDNTKRNSCKAVPKCEWDSAHGCSQRTGPDWDADYAAGGHGGTDGWGSAEGAAAAGGDGTAAAGGGTDAASKEGSGAVHTDAKWWEDGNADDDFVKTSPITVQNKTAAMPRFFDGEMERVPDATMDQIAKVR